MQLKQAANFTLLSAMIYVTEQCPLDCGYCYFRHKHKREVSWEIISRFLVLVKREWRKPGSFVISGGEALMCWERVKKLIGVLQSGFPASAIHMQTNGVLLDIMKTRWLKARGVSLEFGIDGGVETTTRWRKPMNPEMFARIVRNIRRAVDAGIACGCTMTVHPDEVRQMAENLRFIQSLGLSSVDITPAAFMPWNKARALSFKVEYSKMLKDKRLAAVLFTREDLKFIHEGEIDISLHPSGEVLLGDAFLCLPEHVRQKFSLWDRDSGHVRPEMADYYWRLYAGLWARQRRGVYRDYVAFGFEVVNQMMGREYVNVAQMIPLMRFLTRSHLAYSLEKNV